jgi:hypothetical protein
MRVTQRKSSTSAWSGDTEPHTDAHLALVFGAPERLAGAEVFADVRRAHPDAHVVICSTAGEISGRRVLDGSVVVTAITFDHTEVRAAAVDVADAAGSHDAGARLAAAVQGEGLRHVLVLSDGLRINGTELARGLRAGLSDGVAVTGGLSADGARFERTCVGLDAPPREGVIAAIGFYGPRLEVGWGSLGGWDPFGPERLVTRASGNVLYEIDGRSALELYKRYLGPDAAGLPATGLLFPLSVRVADEAPLVRTLLAVDEAAQSLTFAGDVPVGSYARLMKANFDRLVDGAVGAAQGCTRSLRAPADLAILVSCVGRKLVLQQRVEEEVEGVCDVLGPGTRVTGFYSYGEIAPHLESVRCELHNQTMTITTLTER